MATKKSDKTILLLTEEDEGRFVETLLTLEPGPIYLQGTETPAGPGVYLCDQEFTTEEADAQHGFNPDEDVDDLLEDEDYPLDEQE